MATSKKEPRPLKSAGVRLYDDQLDRIRALDRHINVNAYIRDALDHALKRDEKKKAKNA